jgi:hypothetical protein
VHLGTAHVLGLLVAGRSTMLLTAFVLIFLLLGKSRDDGQAKDRN